MSKQDLPDDNSDAFQLTQTESVVYSIWSDVLQIDEINPEDDFFALGGDSLMTMMVLFRVNNELHVELSPSAIYTSPTLREFSQLIDSNREALEGEGLADDSLLDCIEEETGVV
jgi:myxalamid-type nonribosomal peptide synthetase MxaA